MLNLRRKRSYYQAEVSYFPISTLSLPLIKSFTRPVSGPKVGMKAKMVIMNMRIRQLEDALRKLELNVSAETKYQFNIPGKLLDYGRQQRLMKVSSISEDEEDPLAELLEECTSGAWDDVEEVGMIGRQSIEVCDLASVRTSIVILMHYCSSPYLRCVLLPSGPILAENPWCLLDWKESKGSG